MLASGHCAPNYKVTPGDFQNFTSAFPYFSSGYLRFERIYSHYERNYNWRPVHMFPNKF